MKNKSKEQFEYEINRIALQQIKKNITEFNKNLVELDPTNPLIDYGYEYGECLRHIFENVRLKEYLDNIVYGTDNDNNLVKVDRNEYNEKI